MIASRVAEFISRGEMNAQNRKDYMEILSDARKLLTNPINDFLLPFDLALELDAINQVGGYWGAYYDCILGYSLNHKTGKNHSTCNGTYFFAAALAVGFDFPTSSIDFKQNS